MISGPPWDSPGFLVVYALALLIVIALAAYLYWASARARFKAILDERTRLAHDMHDTLAQNFAGVGFQLQALRQSVRSGSIDAARLDEHLTQACELVTRTHRQTSAEIAGLNPNPADGADLLTLLERSLYMMLEGFEFPIRLTRIGKPAPVPARVQSALFQIGREAIANSLRHGRPTHIELVFAFEAKSVMLEIRDDGVGFDQKSTPEGFGVKGMRRRCRDIHGELRLCSSIGNGTTVAVSARYKPVWRMESLASLVRS